MSSKSNVKVRRTAIFVGVVLCKVPELLQVMVYRVYLTMRVIQHGENQIQYWIANCIEQYNDKSRN